MCQIPGAPGTEARNSGFSTLHCPLSPRRHGRYDGAMIDRIDDITDLLLGAAYADDEMADSEQRMITELLAKLLGGSLPDGLSARIAVFDPAEFDVASCARSFAGVPEETKHKLLGLIAAVHEADEEFDFAEDDYLRAVAKELSLADPDLSKYTIEFEELDSDLADVRGAG